MSFQIFNRTSTKTKCKICRKASCKVSQILTVCKDCISQKPKQSKPFILKAHEKSKKQFGLPGSPPKNKDGVRCNICVNQCLIGPQEIGFCGLRINQDGKLVHLTGTSKRGIVSWYYDPLPTNCVADWVCPGGSSSGYPRYSYLPGPEYGYKNLAVFPGACTFNCLFCQNWHYREMTQALSPTSTPERLAKAVDKKTSCICFFGGDPTPQLPFIFATTKIALKQNQERILRICFETNGAMNSQLADKMAKIALETGGCVKFDLKTYNENLHLALTGVSNQQTLKNFAQLSKYIPQREDPPFLIASTLLVPGYVDGQEVSKIAQFIAQLNPEIPYSLLAFYPCFYMSDMPVTSRKQAEECMQAALDVGLKKVKIGNIHLIS